MRSFVAFHDSDQCWNGFVGCAAWAQAQVGNGASVVKIATARAGESHARIVAEVTTDGLRLVRSGRVVPIKSVRAKHGEK